MAQQNVFQSANSLSTPQVEFENSVVATESQATENPFAQALASLDHNTLATPPSWSTDELPGGYADTTSDWRNAQPDDAFGLKLDEEERQKKLELAKQKLDVEVSPDRQTELFNAHKIEEAQKIEVTRQELKAMAREVSATHQELAAPLFAEFVDTGEAGAYHSGFLAKLRETITMVISNVRSANTWAEQARKRNHAKAGIVVDGNQHDQTKAVFDQMHHEVSNNAGA